MDHLFGYIDFEKFKEQMVVYKKGMDENGVIKITSANADDGLGIPKQYDGFDEFFKMFNVPAKDKHSGWKYKVGQKKFKDGMRCEFYQRKQIGNPNDMVRVEASYMGITKDEIAHYYLNPPVDGHKSVKDFRIIEKISEDEVIMYYRITIPMLTDRDFLLSLKVFRDTKKD